MTATGLLDTLNGRRSLMLERLRALVEHESPSRDVQQLDRIADKIAVLLRTVGADQIKKIPNSEGGTHLYAEFGFGHLGDDHSGPPPAVVIGHFDTVWPVGTLESMPFRFVGNRAHGPGIFDMKGGLVLTIAALEAIRDLHLKPSRPVKILFTCDEEVGSPGSRALIEDTARNAAFVLVPEPSLPGGTLKTARKGVGRYTLAIEGCPAHAGVEPEKGRSALLELAHQIIAIQSLSNLSVGTTLNVGSATGGGAINVVPAHAKAEIDLRIASPSEAERVDTALRSLQPVLDGTRLQLSGGLNRPPMVRTEASARLFDQARIAAKPLGIDLKEGSTGGGSDGNFTAGLGIPTLDGLGPIGDGPHALHEHIEIDSLPSRAALIAALLFSI